MIKALDPINLTLVTLKTSKPFNVNGLEVFSVTIYFLITIYNRYLSFQIILLIDSFFVVAKIYTHIDSIMMCAIESLKSNLTKQKEEHMLFLF